MVERFARRNEIGYVKLGLISAITAVNLKIDGTSPNEQPHYESSGKKVLDYLADKESLIHVISPQISERNEETIEKARESFPEPQSIDPLLTLLSEYSRL